MTRTAVRSAFDGAPARRRRRAWTGCACPDRPARGATAATPGTFVASTKNGDWPSYTGDTRGSRYSPLASDHRRELQRPRGRVAVQDRQPRHAPRVQARRARRSSSTGVLYTTAGTRRSVIALDAATGELLWVHRYPEGTRGANAPRQLSGRGLAYWTDGRGDERIIYFTPGYRMIALDAKTGQPVKSFGKDGVVDLKVGVVFGNNQQIDLETGEIGVHSTPVVVKDVVLVGSSMKEGMTVTTHNNTKGLARALRRADRQAVVDLQHDSAARRVRQRHAGWTTPGRSTATPESGRRSRVDEELGLVYLPVETPTSDFYGGKRPGNNLFGESLVCVDLATGKRKWHFQFVHHPIWNDDMSSAPLDRGRHGRRPRRARSSRCRASRRGCTSSIASPASRSGRSRRRPVPKGDVPGEWYSPTQPHPPAALMYGRNTVTRGRPDRLHAGAARAGAEAARALQVDARRRLHAADRRQHRRASSARSTSATSTAARTGRAAATIPIRARCSRTPTRRRSPRDRSRRRRRGSPTFPTRTASSASSSACGTAAGTGTYADVAAARPRRPAGRGAGAARRRGRGGDGRGGRRGSRHRRRRPAPAAAAGGRGAAAAAAAAKAAAA